ncbi:MAG TPA: aminotransferase class V-fold PLP-dependent enzyme [Acidimicrobiales bacterium]
MDDDEKVATIRGQMPSLAGVSYLNTGTSGPLPEAVTAAICEGAQRQLHHPRLGMEYFEEMQALKEDVRTVLAAHLGVRPTEIALTHNTTEGMNFITLGVNWVQGDEAVTTNVEHPGVLLPLWVVKERYGVTIKTADLLDEASDPVAEVARLITPRTKLVSLSHVSYCTGNVLPINEIAAVAHERGVLVLVDGAQAFAALPVDLAELGVDFYAASGQKWLCGPEGTGVLYSSQAAISQIRPTFASYGSIEAYNDYGGMLIKPDGRRFEQGTTHLPNLEGQLAALRWLTSVGPEWAAGRSRQLAATAHHLLSELEGVRVITDRDQAGLVTFEIDGADPQGVVTSLAAAGILARSIPGRDWVRWSLGYFNTAEEIAAAAETLDKILHDRRA